MSIEYLAPEAQVRNAAIEYFGESTLATPINTRIIDEIMNHDDGEGELITTPIAQAFTDSSGVVTVLFELRDDKIEYTGPEYPFGYFDAQVRFAKKWSEITGEVFTDCLRDRTALYRRITNQKSDEKLDDRWTSVVSRITDTTDTQQISHELFSLYLQQLHSHYEPLTDEEGEYFGPFSYEYDAEAGIVYYHFTNPDRTQGSPIDPDKIAQRMEDLHRMFTAIKQKHPEAKRVVGRSWAGNMKSFQKLEPPEVNESLQELSLSEIVFTGNSLWGQFIAANGDINKWVYRTFLERLQKAQTIDDLVKAFPFPVKAKDNPVEVYYKFYKVDASIQENEEWVEDFSYVYYQKMIEALRANGYTLDVLSNSRDAITQDKQTVFLRHDVDVDPERALEMAKLENQLGVHATYMVNPNTPQYDLNPDILKEIIALGHEIGLHFDISNTNAVRSQYIAEAEPAILQAKQQLETLIGQAVQTISFHRPPLFTIGGELEIAGMVNAYASELMGWYLSDSKGSWREGEPLQSFKNPKAKMLQLNTHPIWWGEVSTTAKERIQPYIDKTATMNDRGRAEAAKAELEQFLEPRS